MTALAGMLVAVFVVQAPMTSLDRALHGPPSALAARAQLPALDVRAWTIACRSASVRASLRPHACS